MERYKEKMFCKSTSSQIEGKNFIYYLASVNDPIGLVWHATEHTLIDYMKQYPDDIINLELCNNNYSIKRIDFPKEYEELKEYSGEVLIQARSSIIKVGELAAGYITNQTIWSRVGKQKDGELKSEGYGGTSGTLAGTGFILNDKKIAEIKQYYSDECTLKVMNGEDLRATIISDPHFRRRLAAFYSHEMRYARYMHLDRIKLSSAKRVYDVVKDKFMSIEFLQKDINLLYVIYNLYGAHMYTFEHSFDVAIYTILLYYLIHPDVINDEDMLQDLFISGLLHDIGKMGINTAILDSERNIFSCEAPEVAMRNQIIKHPILSAQILENLCQCDSEIFSQYKNNPRRKQRLINGALYHHVKYLEEYNKNIEEYNAVTEQKYQKFNKSYPRHLEAQSKIEDEEFCAILSIADSLDGMLSPRPYRKQNIDVPKALKFLREDAKLGKLDITKIDLLEKLLHIKEGNNDKYGNKTASVKFDEQLLKGFIDMTKLSDYK